VGWTPFAMLVLLAGLQALPDDQLEAARVDGANWWQQFRNVVLPHLRPFLELTTLLLSMNIIQTFGEIALLTASGPTFGTTNITYYVYLRAFNSFDFGTASAYGLVTPVLTVALAMPALRLLSAEHVPGRLLGVCGQLDRRRGGLDGPGTAAGHACYVRPVGTAGP
jgi:sorbitol/mannitol transport system permease protein